MPPEWMNPTAKGLASRVAGTDMENRASRTKRPHSPSSEDELAQNTKPIARVERETRIRLPTQAPPVPSNLPNALPSNPPRAAKANASPYGPSHMTSSRPTKVSRAAHEQPQRRGHETFSPTSHKSFYGTEAETSKHFPTQNREQERARQDPPPQQQHQMRTASRPDSFVPKAPPLPPSPPPVAGPSRLPAVVKQRTGVNRKSNQKTREPVTIVLSSSDEGEETPEREEQPMPNAQRPSIAANQGDRQSATTAPRYQNSLTANNLQYYGSPRDADSSKRKRPSHSSSVTPQVNGPDEIEDFEDGHDDTVIHLPRPPPKSNVTKRARMQDKNGNSSVTAPSQKKRDPGWLGPVVGYEVDGQNLGVPTGGEDLYLEQQGIKHCKILFRWSNVIIIYMPAKISSVSSEEYSLGLVQQEATTGSDIHAHCFKLRGNDLTKVERDKIEKLFTQLKNYMRINGPSQCEAIHNDQIQNITKAKAVSFRATGAEPDKKTTQQTLSFARETEIPSAQLSTQRPRPRQKDDIQRTAPVPVEAMRRSSRSAVVEQRADREIALRSMPPKPRNPDRVLFHWPPTGRTELVITKGDYHRLYDDEFLNDTLIDFGLRYVVDTRLPSQPTETKSVDGFTGLGQLRPEDVFVFNPFFYKKLSDKTRSREKVSPDPYPEWSAYDSVKKWTNKVDIFSKKFIIVPVNENLHWYMAVIYNPAILLGDARYLKGSTPPLEDASGRPLTRSLGREEEAQDIASVEQAMTNDEKLPSPAARSSSIGPVATAKACDSNVLSPDSQPRLPAGDAIEVQGRNARVSVSVARSEAPRSIEHTICPPPLGEPERAEPPDCAFNPRTLEPGEGPGSPIEIDGANRTDLEKRGLIMTFDSLGSIHPGVGFTLNRWLVYEARDKKNVELSWKPRAQKPLPYKAVSVPPQRNFSDCGVYCLHFMEVLLGDPEGMMDFIYMSMLKKDQLNGQVLDDFKTRWQGEDALVGRRKWREIITELAGPSSSPEERPIELSSPLPSVNGSQESAIEVHSAKTPAQPFRERNAANPDSFVPKIAESPLPTRPLPKGGRLPPALRPSVAKPEVPSPQVLVSTAPYPPQQPPDVTLEYDEHGNSVSGSTVSDTGATAATDLSVATASTSHIRDIRNLRISRDDDRMEVDSEVEGSAISIARESAVKDGRIMPSMMEIDGEEEEEEEEEEEIKEEERKENRSKDEESGPDIIVLDDSQSQRHTHPPTHAPAHPDEEMRELEKAKQQKTLASRMESSPSYNKGALRVSTTVEVPVASSMLQSAERSSISLSENEPTEFTMVDPRAGQIGSLSSLVKSTMKGNQRGRLVPALDQGSASRTAFTKERKVDTAPSSSGKRKLSEIQVETVRSKPVRRKKSKAEPETSKYHVDFLMNSSDGIDPDVDTEFDAGLEKHNDEIDPNLEEPEFELLGSGGKSGIIHTGGKN